MGKLSKEGSLLHGNLPVLVGPEVGLKTRL